MAQNSISRTPESIKNQLLAAQLMQKAASSNYAPYNSGSVNAVRALTAFIGGAQEHAAEQADAAGQQQSLKTFADALRAKADQSAGAPPSYGSGPAAAAATSPGGAGSDAVASGTARNPSSYDPKATEALIRQKAPAYGIDPDAAVRIARSEGLNVYHGDGGSSFGPFQLHYGGVAGGGNAVGGLGDAFTKKTGLDARDPSTVPQQVDFALQNAAQGGWGPWHGRKTAQMGVWDGIGQSPQGGSAVAANAPAPNAQPVSAPTLPPGITPDMVSAPPSPFGAAPSPMRSPTPSPSILAAALRGPNGGSGPGATPLPASIQPSSPFGSLPTSMAPPVSAPAPDPLMASAPLPDISAPPLTVQGGGTLTSPTPMDQQGGIGGPAPSPQMLASLLSKGTPLQGSGSMLPPSAPAAPASAPRSVQPSGATPASIAASNPGTAADLSSNGAMMAAMGPGGVDPGMAAVFQSGMQANAKPASGLSSDNLPGMDNFMSGGGSPDGAITASPNQDAGYTGGFNNPMQSAMNGSLTTAPAPFGTPDPSAPPNAVASAPPPAAPSTPSPAVMAQALRAQQPTTDPSQQPSGDSSLPQTGPMPPPGVQSLANADAPAPNAQPAGPASVPPGLLAQALRGPQPLGLAGDGGADPSSARSFLTQQAQSQAGGPSPSVLASALRGGSPAAASTSPQQSGGGPLDFLGSLLGGGNSAPPSGGGISGLLGGIPGLGSLFGGSQSAPAAAGPNNQPAGSPVFGGQGQAQPFAPGGQAAQSSQPATAGMRLMGSDAINAAIMDPRISDSVKLELMKAPEHAFAIAPNGQMFDSKTGQSLGGNFEKPTPQQSVQTPDGRVFSFDPTSGSYKEGPSGGAAPTTEQKDYDTYVKQTTAAGNTPLPFFDYQKTMKQAGATNVTVDQKAENAEAQARGAGLGKRMNEIADDSSKVTTEAVQVARIRDLLGSVDTGPGTAYAEKFRQATGIALDKNTDRVQALQAAVQNLAPALRVPGSGSQSDTELKNFQASIPGLLNTPGGNEQILRTLEGAIAYRQQRSSIAQKWQEGDITAKDADSQIAVLPSPFAAKPGDTPGQPSTTVPTIGNPADALKLPPGTQFRDPNGVLRTVPGR